MAFFRKRQRRGKAAPPQDDARARPRLFLSHAAADADAALEVARHIRHSGVDVWLDVDQLKPGDRWMEDIERALLTSTAFAVFVGRSGVHNWVDREVRLALERATHQADYRLFPILGPDADPDALPAFLKQHQWLDLRLGIDPGKLREVGSALQGSRVMTRAFLNEGQGPFMGLRFFDQTDAILFFGRDHETAELLIALRRASVLTLIGDSGCGKSSLIRAGLIPALRRGRFYDGDQWVRGWRISVTRPGSQPFEELARDVLALDPNLSTAERLAIVPTTASLLSAGHHGLGRCISQVVPRGVRTLLVVDQFEELFTQVPDATERLRFIDSLLAASGIDEERPVHIVILLRADFYAHCWEHPELPQRIASNLFAVQAIRQDRLEEVIRGPAALGGVDFESGLVETLLEETGNDPGNLPLLEHALSQLWERRAGGNLTHAAYDSIGRLAGALHAHAEDVYSELPSREQGVARRMLLALTAVFEDQRETRRRLAKAELLAAEHDSGVAARVLSHLTVRRLVIVEGAAKSSEGRNTPNHDMVEVAHEALIRRWHRLQDWLKESRPALILERTLRRAADDWQALDFDPDSLIRGKQLERAIAWAESPDARLSPIVREFLQAASYEERTEASTRERDRKAALGALAAGVAHEVNTPIVGISSYAQMLLEQTPEGDPRHELLKKVELHTLRASKILYSLLDLARPQHIRGEPVSLVRLLRDLLEEWSERIGVQAIEVIWHEPDQELVVESDETLLVQVFGNLLSNALVSMPHGGILTCSLAANQQKITACIEDTGPGIAEENLERVFEPFFTTWRSRERAGLGLTIAREIVGKLGGSISVQSTVGVGSTFLVELPCSPNSPPTGE